MKKYLSLILAVLLAIAVFPVSSFAEDEIITNGNISETVTFNINTSTKTMTISGSGPIPDLSASDKNEWSRNAYAQTVIIEDGITAVGSFAFYQTSYVRSVVIADSVT